VHRILIENTIEDRIIAIQEKKRALIDAALDEKTAHSLGRLGRRELAYLFVCPCLSQASVLRPRLTCMT